MIIVTGAAGFVGSCLASSLNTAGYNNLILVDDFSIEAKRNNFIHLRREQLLGRQELFTYLNDRHIEVEFIFHIGAKTDTTLFDDAVFDELNVAYSQRLWQAACEYQLPFVYASSAATYGDGAFGYSDNEAIIPQLQPLNPYGWSKQKFDIWALTQTEKPWFWAGLKFFNVYGPNEYHKARMASVIFHAYNQISNSGRLKLFKSHRPDYLDGGQTRDFVYVKDLVNVLLFLMHQRKHSGVYNLGTGHTETFNALAAATFKAMGVQSQIDYIDTPFDIRDKYQYYTQADMSKLRSIGYNQKFMSLEEGVNDYVQNYLGQKSYL